MKAAEILNERFINLIGQDPRKEDFADEVYHMLQKAYAPIGGIKGLGFSSPQDMIKNIPFWKAVRKGGEIIAVALYKDSGGRKRVAVATDGTAQGKKALGEIMTDDLQRAFFEVSGPSLRFLVKTVGVDTLKKYARSPDEVERILDLEVTPVDLDEPEAGLYPQLAEYFYQREIGGHGHTKIMFGTPGKKIVTFM